PSVSRALSACDHRTYKALISASLLAVTVCGSLDALALLAGSGGAIMSSAATICQRPFRSNHVSVHTKRPSRGSPIRRSQDSLPCATAVLPKKRILTSLSRLETNSL